LEPTTGEPLERNLMMTSFTKIGICAKETSETEYWLELAPGADVIALTASEEPLREAQELLAIFVASGRTAKSRR
jgi:hypothetical protein